MMSRRRLTQPGAALADAIMRDDQHGVGLLMNDLSTELRSPEAILFVATAAAHTWDIRTDRPQTGVADM
jgi:hypothetical protein